MKYITTSLLALTIFNPFTMPSAYAEGAQYFFRPPGYKEKLMVISPTIVSPPGDGEGPIEEPPVDPIVNAPEIASISGMKVFTIDSPITPITPVVTESNGGGAWTTPGLAFTLNKALPSGLDFNTSTGEISGTPTIPSYTDGLIITVSDGEGNLDTAGPFDVAIRDVSSGLPAFNAYLPTATRSGESFTTESASISGRPSGTITYSFDQNYSGLSIDPSTGAVSGSNTSERSSTILAIDQSGYQAITEMDFFILAESVTYDDINISNGVSVNVMPVIENMQAPIEFSINKDLPSGLDLDTETGLISGTTNSTAIETDYIVTATDHLATIVSNPFSIMANVSETWRLVIIGWNEHSDFADCVGLSEIKIKSGTEDITEDSSISAHEDIEGVYKLAHLTDEDYNTNWFGFAADVEKFIQFTTPTDQPFTHVELYRRGDGASACTPTVMQWKKSIDGENFTTIGNTFSVSPIPVTHIPTTPPSIPRPSL